MHILGVHGGHSCVDPKDFGVVHQGGEFLQAFTLKVVTRLGHSLDHKGSDLTVQFPHGCVICAVMCRFGIEFRACVLSHSLSGMHRDFVLVNERLLTYFESSTCDPRPYDGNSKARRAGIIFHFHILKKGLPAHMSWYLLTSQYSSST